MYYCINCQKLHKKADDAARLFQSGYVLVNDTRVPLGFCQIKKKSFQKFQLNISS